LNQNQNITFNISLQSTDDTYIFNPEFPSYENQTNLVNGRISYLVTKNKSVINFGSDWQTRSMTSLDRGNHEDYYMGSFLNYITTWKGINFNPSFRLDYNQHYGLQFCPQFDINYNDEFIKIRASMGRTIRSSDFTERFYNNNYSGALSAGRNIGNPNLSAEKTLNHEVGIDFKINKNIRINTTMFYRKSSNLIDWVLTSSENIPVNIDLINNETYFFAQNISKLNTRGWETELWFQLYQDDKIKSFGSIGYLKIFQNQNNDEELLLSKYLANNSGDKFNYNVSIAYKHLGIQLNGVYKARNKEEDITINQTLEENYFIHNSKIMLRLTKNISTSVELMNIFNTQYSDFLGAIMPKRWLIFGIECKL